MERGEQDSISENPALNEAPDRFLVITQTGFPVHSADWREELALGRHFLAVTRRTSGPGGSNAVDVCKQLGYELPWGHLFWNHSSAEIRSILAEQIAADRVLIHSIDLIAFACDASFYRLIPKAVVLAKDETEIASLFQFSQREGIPMTFLLRAPACQDSRSLMAW